MRRFFYTIFVFLFAFVLASCSGESTNTVAETRVVNGLVVIASGSSIESCADIAHVVATTTDATTVIDDSVEDCLIELPLVVGSAYVISFVNQQDEFIATVIADSGSVFRIDDGTTVIDLGSITIDDTNRATFTNNFLDYVDTDRDGTVDSQDSTPCGALSCLDLYSCEYFGFLDTDGDKICDTWDSDIGSSGDDYDSDGVLDDDDNCLAVSNVDQADVDGDAQGDACDPDNDNDGIMNASDNCEFMSNVDQADYDSDGTGDVCDADVDGDGIADASDNCPSKSNVNQADLDTDGTGDVCDSDDDGDGVADGSDNCPIVSNANQLDTDSDELGNLCDDDDDGDEVLDVSDNCSVIVNVDQLDTDSDLIGNACDSDDDGDTVDDDSDNCPLVANADQLDTDSDSLGNVCDADDDADGDLDVDDNCPLVANADQLDTDSDSSGDACDTDDDGDGVLDVSDNCLLVVNAEQVDTDDDGSGDSCDTDDDGDGVLDVSDNCTLLANAEQTDTDSDGQGDTCDTDDDGDGILDGVDICPYVSDAGQEDNDEDGFGDVCDTNDDNDNYLDVADNCPFVANNDQLDTDDDDSGDACDTDDDGDGDLDVDDNCPLIANADQLDTDSDGSGNVCDTDDDGDGDLDVDDNCPLVANADQADGDSDGVGNLCDNCPSDANADQADSDADSFGDVCDIGAAELIKLTASNVAASAFFGFSVAVDDTYAIVGARSAAAGGYRKGSAYIFDLTSDGYPEISILTASDAVDSDFLGGSAAISGDYVVISAYGKISYTGAAYIFEKGDAWSASQTETIALTASDGEVGDYFGIGVDISGNYAIVGAYKDHNSPDLADVGAAYIYERTDGEWPATETQKLLPSNPSASDWFGTRVSISGDYAVVGSCNEDTVTQNTGAVYVFQRIDGTWTQTQMLTADDGEINDYFGRSVAIDGDYLVAGASGEDDMGGEAGAAYVFKLTDGTWTQTAKLTALDGQASDGFGASSVDITGNRIVIGAYKEAGGDGDPASRAGAAYVFMRNAEGNWAQAEKLMASDFQTNDNFGYSVAISDSFILTGAYGEDYGDGDTKVDAGAAYLY